MDKRGQMNFDNGVFSQDAPTEKNTNMFQRVLQGIIMAIFLFIISPILVYISNSMQPLVCGNPLICLFFKFIVPATILGGIFGILKYIWRND
jgi:hypothetical protein